MPILVILRGGGDLASGVALRLYRAGIKIMITELPQPLVVRRLVSFAEAVYAGQITVEDVVAHRAKNLAHARRILEDGQIPVLVDAQVQLLNDAQMLSPYDPDILIDGRMTKHPPELNKTSATLVIGLGPGFIAGRNCHAAIETNRGHRLGRVIWYGAPEADTGIPEGVLNRREERILRAPISGVVKVHAQIGDHLEAGQLVAQVGDQPVNAPFKGVLRGLIHSGIQVQERLKIGDVDPRDDPTYSRLVSEKSLAVGGGVLEAILSQKSLRARLWD